MRRLFFVMMTIICGVVLASCAEEGDPAEAVIDYLEAKVASDEDALRGLLCSAMEGDLSREAASLASVDATLENASCERGDTEGDFTLVTCEGHIAAIYGTETREFPLGTYRTVQEDGEWKYCGEG